jgi:hypothetical protein
MASLLLCVLGSTDSAPLQKPLILCFNVFHYRTDTLYNFQSETCCPIQKVHSPLCQQSGSALHFLPGCQHNVICSMITERHNVAYYRLIMYEIHQQRLLGRLYSSYGCWQH